MQSDYSSICKSEVQPSSSDGDGAECRICRMPAHGLHFGLLTCGACAAFFRRSVACRLQYTCRLENGMCELNKSKLQHMQKGTGEMDAMCTIFNPSPVNSHSEAMKQHLLLYFLWSGKLCKSSTKETYLPYVPNFAKKKPRVYLIVGRVFFNRDGEQSQHC